MNHQLPNFTPLPLLLMTTPTSVPHVCACASTTHTCARASRNIIAGAQSTRPLGAEDRAHCSAAHARDLGPLQGITVNYIAHILRSSESTLSGIIYEEAVVVSIVCGVWICSRDEELCF